MRELEVDEVKGEGDVRSFHSAQLRFARKRVPIGVDTTFLKIKALRDFQILQRSSTTLDKWRVGLADNDWSPSWSVDPGRANGLEDSHWCATAISQTF